MFLCDPAHRRALVAKHRLNSTTPNTLLADIAARLQQPRSLADERDLALIVASLCRKGGDDED